MSLRKHFLISVLALAAIGLDPASEPAPSGLQGEGFIGEIRWVPFNFAPRGWALCDGQLLPIAQHTALFSLLGTTYGGDGRTTFQLPDLRGRAAVHAGQGPGLTQRRLGEKGGAEQVTLTGAQMPSHRHSIQVAPTPGVAGQPTQAILGSSFSRAAPTSAAPVMSDEGGSQAHPNMSPFLGLNAVIALEGVYPSRN